MSGAPVAEPNWQSVAQMAMSQRDKAAQQLYNLEINLQLRIGDLEAALADAQRRLAELTPAAPTPLEDKTVPRGTESRYNTVADPLGRF